MSGEDLYRGAVALGQGLSGGGIEGMLQRERQKAELENAMAQLRLQAELKQRAEQAKWEHEAQQQAELEARAREIFGEGGGYAGLDNTSILQSALSGPGPVETAPMRSGSSMFTPNPRAMAFLAANDPKAFASVMNSERGNALESGLQENPMSTARIRLLGEQAGTEKSQQYANYQRGHGYKEDTRRKKIDADTEDELRREQIRAWAQLGRQRETAGDANAARATAIGSESTQKVNLYEQRIQNEIAKGVNLGKAGENIDARTEKVLSDIENDAELTEATKKKLQAQTITEGFRAKLVQEDAATERAKQGTETAKQGKIGAEQKRTEQATTIDELFGKAKTATEEARARVFGSRATSIESKEAREAAAFPVKLSQEIEKLDKIHAETTWRQKGALNQESQMALAKARAERIAKMTDREMELLKSRGALTDQQAGWYKSKRDAIAFDLANPGIKLTEGLSVKLMEVITNPKATRAQKDAAMKQLDGLLQGFPDLTVQTTPGEEGFMGIGSTPDRMDILHKMRGLEDLSSSNLLRDEGE